MLQRGRKSGGTLTSSNVTAASSRLTAPSSLTTAERKLFNELTTACDRNHFRTSDLPLLISYVQASLLAQTAAHDPKRAGQWASAVKLQGMLSTRLRMSPQSRADPKTVARQGRDDLRAKQPWEDRAQYEQRCRESGFDIDENEGDE